MLVLLLLIHSFQVSPYLLYMNCLFSSAVLSKGELALRARALRFATPMEHLIKSLALDLLSRLGLASAGPGFWGRPQTRPKRAAPATPRLRHNPCHRYIPSPRGPSCFSYGSKPRNRSPGSQKTSTAWGKVLGFPVTFLRLIPISSSLAQVIKTADTAPARMRTSSSPCSHFRTS